MKSPRATVATMMTITDIRSLLNIEADTLLDHVCSAVPKTMLHAPDTRASLDIFQESDRSADVISNLRTLYSHGRLGNTGYLSIFPVDQGIEHSAGSSFATNPAYFDPSALAELAIKAQCNAIASTLGGLGIIAKAYADKIPFIVKLNHNELLTYPNRYDQTLFATPKQAKAMGALGVGATIYFGAENSASHITEISRAFAEAHDLGLFTVLWCYLRNPAFLKDGKDYHLSADLSAQANHIGVTMEADIIKQKLPTLNGGYTALSTGESPYGKLDPRIYTKLASEHPIDLARYQVLHCYCGRIPLINSGGPSGSHDLRDVIRSAVINKRAGGSGLICGRKAFQKSLEEGIALLHSVQDVYLCEDVTVA